MSEIGVNQWFFILCGLIISRLRKIIFALYGKCYISDHIYLNQLTAIGTRKALIIRF